MNSSFLRLATCLGKPNKSPQIAITSNLSVWLGAGDADLSLEPGELFGFGTGAFEEVVVRSAGMLRCFRWKPQILIHDAHMPSPDKNWLPCNTKVSERSVSFTRRFVHSIAAR